MSNIINKNQSFFVENNTRFVFIDGDANDVIEKCYATLKVQLSIPDYFGNNLDALEEVMNDLDWIEEEKINIIISGENNLLKNDLESKNDFLEILETSSLEKISIVYLIK